MRTIIQSLRRDHRDIEQLLRVLEAESDVFGRAEQPDYELLTETIDYLGAYLEQYYYPKEDLLFDLQRRSNAACASAIDAITAERAKAVSSLHALAELLREILNEEGVLRQAFDDAARSFIQHERRQVELEEQRLFPMIRSAVMPADWAALHARLRSEDRLPRARWLKERLRVRRRWIIREEEMDQVERNAPRRPAADEI